MSLLGAGLRAALIAVLAVLGLWAVARFAGTGVAVAVGLIGGFAFVFGLAFAGMSRLWQAGGRLLFGLRDWLKPAAPALAGATTATEEPSFEVRSVAAYPSAAAMQRDIATAAGLSDAADVTAARLDRLARAGASMHDQTLARAIDALVDAGRKLADRLAAAPRPMQRMQRALSRQLASVEAVLVTLLALQESDGADPALVAQAIAVIERLADDLNRRRRASGHDVLETEARLKVLQDELAAAGQDA